VRVLPGVPLVVLIDDPRAQTTAASFPPHARAAASLADAALGGLHELACQAASQRARLDEALAEAIEACRVLAAATLRCVRQVTAGELPAPSPIHEYFGVRQAAISPAQAAAHAAAVVYRGVADLQYPLIDVNDLVTEVATMRLVLADLIGPAGAGAPGGGCPRYPGEEYRPSGEGLERWIVAHHVYFLFNLRAAAEVHAAIRALRRDDTAAAAAHLAHATRYVRGFTAAMAHSTAMPASYYNRHVRHTMGPPHTKVNLTGGMQPQHKAFRTAMRRLIEALPQDYDDLVRRDPGLATARSALLNADLIDIERHAHVADKLVGDDHSLVQREAASENAVSMLRTMRHLRAARYALLVPYGDRLAMAAVGQ
jgi:hypothetical protein